MVDKFKVIAVMNEAMLKLLKDKNKNYEENLKIKNYLKDEAFFFKIDKIQAYKILENVGVLKSQIEEVYNQLIAPNVYYDLLNTGKINENDNSIIIKYNTYNSNDLFKKQN